MLLNDGTHNFTSYSYNTSEALDIAVTSSEIFPNAPGESWTQLEVIISQFLLNLRKGRKYVRHRKCFGILERLSGALMHIKLSLTPFTNHLEENWKNFRTIILDNAKTFIPRGNIRRHVPFFTHYASSLKPLLDKRDELRKSLGDGSLHLRAEINKINAETKLIYTQLKRSRWKDMCESLDYRTANPKLWRIVKDINREQEQSEERDSVTDNNGQNSAKVNRLGEKVFVKEFGYL
ncbi:uncharacterized protein TNIN_216541 [Trichonephila inaurata madagascariensis]|uniref:Uncharacterized protein n=1 Tax=Trichonephila inaurata madagascariensis TaxID=2747483 RepID=A0A8X6YX49_9ARAC|nr:uncharacterized protein TNIN_216541 [Trichonephila inaurata madagascariensis]